MAHRRTARRAFVPALALLLGAVATARAATVRTFPADCPVSVEQCVAASAAGDVVRIATEQPIAVTLILNRSVTLEASPGVHPRIAPGYDVNVNNAESVPTEYTIRGLTLENGRIRVVQSGTGPIRVTIADNVAQAATGPFGAIDVTTYTITGDAGPIAFDIRNNDVAPRPSLNEDPVGIRVEPGTKADAAGSITGNRVSFPDIDTEGDAIVLRNESRTLTADVIGNATSGAGYDYGVFLDQRDAAGTLTARVASNVVRGADANERDVTGVAGYLAAGALRATVVQNTFARLGGGVVFDAKEPVGTFEAVVANNVVAVSAGRGIDADAPLIPNIRFGPNLIFDVQTSHLVAGTLIADPRFVSATDFHLAPGSPAIDAGATELVPADLTTDFAGNPRVAGGAVDLGAFETPCPDGTFTPGVCPALPPPAACVPADCDDGDPCTADECRAGACVQVVRAGLEGARCACDRPAPPACAADSVPSAIRRRTTQACTLLDRAGATSRPDRLLRRAARAWARAARLAARRRVSRPRSPECRSALAAGLRDAEQRATNALGEGS